MPQTRKYKLPNAYKVTLAICLFFLVAAFILQPAQQVFSGFVKILFSRGILVSDYVALSGIGSALFNSVVSVCFFLGLLLYFKKEPDGAVIASLWITFGFSLFGKNILNSLPIVIGIWLYAKTFKKQFSDYLALCMLSATIAPIISEIFFLRQDFNIVRLLVGTVAGMFIGFIFPIVAEATKKMHSGYCLYNSGIAGGLIATFGVCGLRSFGVEVLPENLWDTAHTPHFTVISLVLSFSLIAYGLAQDGLKKSGKKLVALIKETGKDDNDFFIKYNYSCYINMGALCLVATATMLLVKIPLNGPTFGGILTVAGFGALGKHPKNVVPIFIGALLATNINHLDQTAAGNALAILFSSGLAPIAGKFKWYWGIVAGIVHVTIAVFVGYLNGGLNLYNNGFAGGFVSLFLVPIIIALQTLVSNRRTKNTLE